MINFYEAECKQQKDQDVNKITVPLGDDREMTQALQHFVDCVKRNLSGEQQLRYCQSFYICIYQIFYATYHPYLPLCSWTYLFNAYSNF